MNSDHANFKSRPLSRALRLREAALRVFCDPVPRDYALLRHLSQKEWQALLRWLDTSGLALYFLDRLSELDLLELLPSDVHERLLQNLADNSERVG